MIQLETYEVEYQYKDLDNDYSFILVNDEKFEMCANLIKQL